MLYRVMPVASTISVDLVLFAGARELISPPNLLCCGRVEDNRMDSTRIGVEAFRVRASLQRIPRTIFIGLTERAHHILAHSTTKRVAPEKHKMRMNNAPE